MLIVQVPVPRNVTIDDAKERMEMLLPRMREQFGEEVPITDIEVHWNDYDATFAFEAKGYKITGTMVVGHNNIIFQSRLPFLVNFYQDKIVQAVRDNATALLNQPSQA